MLTILQGDALTKLRELPDESAQCCVTSPPYWGLRDYGTATWEGGDTSCDHVEYGTDRGRRAELPNPPAGWSGAKGKPFHYECRKCGATRQDNQIGLEESPEAYVAKIAEVFREVRRALKNDGTLWLNLGDSYATGGTRQGNRDGIGDGSASSVARASNGRRNVPSGLKEKDLCGIPWRVAFALQADGWYLRSDIIWHKPNPMPESVADRPTKAHEYLFLMSKRERYFYDAEAIKEAQSAGTFERFGNGKSQRTPGIKEGGSARKTHAFDASTPLSILPNGRNKRSVWTVPTAPYNEAHFATFPPDLIKPCILAGSRAGDTILDPFGGSGTTGAVAIELGRKAILIELNPAYIPLIEQRCSITPGFI